MGRYTCDVCGKRDLTKKEVKDVCIECFEKITQPKSQTAEEIVNEINKEENQFQPIKEENN